MSNTIDGKPYPIAKDVAAFIPAAAE